MCDCIFCKIINGDIPSDKVYEDENLFAFRDIHPLAPVHVLIVPKIHISSLNDVNDRNEIVLSGIFSAAKKIAESLGIAESGYRFAINTGKDGGQEVMHLHAHVMGGAKLTVPSAVK